MLRTPLAIALMVWIAACGSPPGPGEIEGAAVPDAVVRARAERQAAPAAQRAAELDVHAGQILFGDLHVHTSWSYDAFMNSLPMMQGEGLHPAADACDFARYCADLDFWSINDHAGTISPRAWAETRESIRQCNARAGDPDSPDLISLVGWEWTQVGRTSEDHYGHKNVVLRGTADDELPARPIAASSARAFEGVMDYRGMFVEQLKMPLFDLANVGPYLDAIAVMRELGAPERCPDGVDTRELPADCREVAMHPGELADKLEQWGFDHLIIPHGTAWGWYTPPGSSYDHQLEARNRPESQGLFEIYSGHGNSEEYRPWRSAVHGPSGELVCPEPTADYTPCCWRAGELIRERCEDPGSAECEDRVRRAREYHMDLGPGGHLAVSGESVEDWLDCGQCRDCFLPAFHYRPAQTAQYALALSSFDDAGDAAPRRFRFGFIGSSDNHTARPGTGYKEYERIKMTEAKGPRDQKWIERMYVRGEPSPEPVPRSAVSVAFPETTFFDKERGGSFFMTGGLVAAHARARDRDALWEALEQREVYATSGPRILLWFDLLDGPGRAAHPMGSEVTLAGTPRFRVRAAGAFVQKPGCPEHAQAALEPGRLEYLCRGECYHPGDRRQRIERIEIVRIRPQLRPDEPVAGLIEDPWLAHDCPPDPDGCTLEFEDPGFAAGGREVIYYARVLQEPTPAVNGGGLRCVRDADGSCVEARPCYSDPRTPPDDDCLADVAERAWASPIFVRWQAPALAAHDAAP